MAVTQEYLNQLLSDRNTLADNLTTMGVSASQSETFTSLVPKVLDIAMAVEDGSLIHPFTMIAELNATMEVVE